MVKKFKKLTTDGLLPMQEKTVDIVENGTIIVEPNLGKTLSKVTANVNVMPNLQEKTTTINGEVTADEGYDGMSKVTVNITHQLQSKTIVPTTESQTITADEGNDGLSSVTVEAVTSAIDANIKAENIKAGVTILGVTGTHQCYITVASVEELNNITAEDGTIAIVG